MTYIACTGLCVSALLLTLSLPMAHESPVVAFFLATVAISAWRGGWYPGVWAAVLTSFELDFFVFPPVSAFVIGSWAHFARFISYIGEAIATVVLFARLRDWQQRNNELLTEAQAARHAAEFAAEQMRESEERLALVVNSAQIGTWDWLLQSNELIWSTRCLELFGVPPDTRMTYRRFLDTIHPEDRARVDTEVRTALGQHGDYSTEMRVIRSDGSVRWVASMGRAYCDPGGRPRRMSGVAIDITERRQTMEALLRAEKLASMGRMAATVAHEINNPVAAVMNSLYIARSDTSLSEQARQYLDLADEELKRVSQITRQALGFYRESAAPSLVPVGEVIDSALALAKSRIKARHACIHKQYRGAPSALVSAGELRQVICNLLSNSLDAIEEHGTVAVRLSSFCVDSARPWTRITLADNGSGIAPALRAQVFEPLFTTKEHLGTGLGLWVSKQLVQKHGGSIRVHSRVDGARRGTTFSILLPGEPPGNEMPESPLQQTA